MLFFSFVLFQCLNLSMSSSFRNALATVKIVNPLGRLQQCFIQLEKCFLPFKFLLPTAAIPEWDGACKNILFEVVDAPTVVGVVLCGTAGWAGVLNSFIYIISFDSAVSAVQS